MDRTVSVTITGTNDAPVVAATDVTGAVTEQVTPLGNLTDTGTIAFTDVDLTDAHTISPTITASAGALGALTASVTSDTTGSGLGGVITWNYSVADSDVEYLAKDQTKVETFTITLDDGNGGTVDRTVSVTITGTNDAPVVAATDVTGAVTEQVTPLGNLTDTGTIAFTDVDLTDAHTISPTITASAGALGALTASVTSDTTGSGLGGVITWNYSVADSDVEYLAKDQTKVETFTITLDDGNGGTVDRTVSVTITGTNDAPVVAATDVTGAVTEQVTPLGNLTDTGTIAFTDVDLTDAHTISPTITASAGALGALTASVTSDTTGSGLGGVITWNYSVADSDVEYLAKDQTKVETFTITLDDGNGGTVDRTVSVTITGTNDAPVVAATDVTGAVTEQVTPLGNLTDTGTIAFTDVDLTDAHTISPTITASAGALGALTASVTSDTTGSGLGGVITWNYSVADSDVEYLAKDQTKVETFTITLDDGNGGTVDRTVSVTITGTNDAPVVAATDVTGAVTEQVTPLGNLTDTGTIAFTDVDLTDAHTISPTITASAGALGALTASVTSDTTGSGLGGVITWNYSVADSDVEYLAKDQTKVETFTITLDDGNGGTVDRTVSVTITGTNDAPVVAATDVTGAVTEQVTPLGNLTDTGTIAFTDVDLTDAHTISPTITASAGALGALTASVTSDTTGSGLGGVITWNYSVADSDVEYLAKDQTKVETFTITLDDGNGGTVDRTVSVTITGTNDAPVVAATDVTGAVTEQVTPLGNLTDTGTIAFTDVDLTDAHTISPTITASAGALGALTASVTSDTTGSGLGGVITWNYSVADSDVEYLAKDQTKVETFTITLDDGNGGTVDRTVSVTITGTNDAPVVAATDVTGAVTEQVTPLGNLTDTGTIAFTDVDLTDAHTISPTITASAGALGALTASVTSDTTGSGLGGVITWNYSVADSDVEYLAKDQTKVETFTITLDDGNGGTVDRTVSVTITGTNDAPVVAATDVTGAVTEQVTPLGNLTDTGTIAFTDVDLTDAHTISPTITASAGALGALTASVTSDTTGSGLGGVITWNYSVADSDVEYLAKDQTKVETFTITLDDGNGGTVDRTVSVTITGTNDAPVVAATDVTGAVTEQVTPLGNLTDTGTIAFTDVDLTDAHTISPTITASAGALGALTASVTSDTTGSGLGGVITWNYSVADSDVEYLAKDQTKVETFTITLDDGNGGTVDRTVSVTITGTNDAPVVAATDVTGAVTEQVTPLGNLTDTGTIAFTDVDLTDAHTISPTITASAGALGALTASVTSDTTGSGLGGVITWNYSVADSDVEYLAKDQTKVETFTITLDDGNGGTVDRTVSVTITGTNDAPVVAATDVTGAVTEQVTPLGNLTDTGTIAFTDVDLTDAHTISPTITASAGALGALTASVTSDTTGSGLGGVITWNYSVADSDVEYLAKDQTKVETFTITLDDGNGGTVDRTVSVTITGTNDAPVVAATDVTGAVTEQVTPLGNLTDTGTIAFTDVDLTDAHTISPTITASAGALGALTASVTSDTTGSGLGGVITWNYSVADSDVEYLAKDQTKVETFTITLDDGNGGTVDRTVSVTITGTNDAPVVAATDVTGAVTEQVTPLGNLTDTGTIAFTDVDLTDAHTISPTITASAGALGALTASVTSDTTGSGLGGVITWNYSVADSDVEYLAKDQTKVETFTITLDDGNGGTVDRTVSVTITGTNDAPVIDLNGAGAGNDATASFTEQTPLVIAPLATVTDVDSANLTSLTATLTARPDGNAVESLSLNASATAAAAGLTVLYTASTGILSITGSAAKAAYQTILDGIVYNNTSDTPTTAARTVNVVASDGTDSSASHSVTISVTPVNDAPVIDLNGAGAGNDATASFTEQTPLVIAPLATVTNADSANLTSLTATLTARPDGNGVESLSLNASATAAASGLTVLYTASTGILSITGSASQATYQTILDGIVYNNTSDTPTTAARTVNVVASDGTDSSASHSVTISVTPVNDAPIAADDAGSATEAGGIANGTAGSNATGNVITTGPGADSDADNATASLVVSAIRTGTEAGSGTSGTVGTGLAGQYGTLTLNTDGSYSYAVNNSNATVQALNVGGTLTDTFTYTVKDPGNLTDTAQLTVIINGANDAPVAVADSATTTQNVPVQISVLANDTEVDNTNAQLSVTQINGSAVTVGVAVNVANGTATLNADKTITYTPNTGFSGSTFQAFTYTVSDGQATSSAAVNLTVTAAPPPTSSDWPLIVTKSAAVSWSIAQLLANDSDVTNDLNSITSARVQDSSGAFISTATIAGGNISFTAPGSAANDFLSVTLNDGRVLVWKLIVDNSSNSSDLQTDGAYTTYRAPGTPGTYIASYLDISNNGNKDLGGAIVSGSLGGYDVLVGRNGDDILVGRSSGDTLMGGGGTDTIVGDQSDILLDGGANSDTLQVGANFTSTSDAQIVNIEAVTLTASGLTLDLTNQSEALAIAGSSGIDIIKGGSGADSITGGTGADTMTGNGGIDTFIINTGHSTVTIAGAGNSGTISGYDVITDFNTTAGGDILDLPIVGASATSGNVNGAGDSTLTIGGDTVQSHNVTNGIATFFGTDTFTAPLTVTSTGSLAAVVQYLLGNDIGNAGSTVAFTTSGAIGNHTFVYQQTATTNGNAGGYTLVELANVTLTNVSGAHVAPAGAAGEAINLGLTNPADHVGSISVSISGVPVGWTVSQGIDNGDGTWSVQTNDVTALAVTSPGDYAGALSLHMSQTWIDSTGGTGLAMITDNVEAYAPGSPIFAWSGDDVLTGSSGNDLFVFSQPIGNDTVHSFDADKIDLIGYSGFASFADVQAHLADDANGNAVITLGDGQSIMLDGVHSAALTGSNFVFDQTPVVNNAGTMTIGDGALLPLSGTINNTGLISLDSNGSDTLLQLIQHGITLQGGGQIILSDSDANVISGTAADVTLTNIDNTISGAGQLGGGLLGLDNQCTIIATGTHALVINTGGSTVSNSGTLEATGSGGLTINGAVANSGLIWANGGDIAIDGQVTGDGDAIIGNMSQLEFHAATSSDVIFAADAAGTLRLDDSFDFSGSIAGMTSDDKIDFGDILFNTGTSAIYQANQDGSGGTLLVSDGTHDATLHLLGAYETGTFTLADDGTGRTAVAYNPADDFHFV
ncbi:VCBS domain-containing protein [Mesorhizobium sp. ISC11]|uniref:VCBS domain-containing protein n=1 Tax=Mesorhizobium sp. ISC11 TaxID=3076428 RepID=UPI00301D1E65